MNVYGQIRKVIQEFELADFWDKECVDTKEVLNCIRKTWTYLERFVKNIEPEYTNYHTHRLQNTEYNDLLITKDMLNDAKRRYLRLKSEVKNVK
ncbi:hypothetical protein [Desulfosporosinus sp.]|uniref:hypothetical protein n=1 Tax=Desulfosporosinus sp. TaxID=157907 RepID=UPI0025C5AA48|nr:hypothetical protein [Desulfosporosinus sp.]MBC2727239.1 hypothetical protein [Desulfosporosinus sp.]